MDAVPFVDEFVTDEATAEAVHDSSSAEACMQEVLSVFGAKPEAVDAHITKFLKDSIISSWFGCALASCCCD